MNGIREFARAKGARTAYVPLETPDLRVDDDVLEQLLDDAGPAGRDLFAYPAQSNFSGVKHPLEWIAAAQERGWDVLVDGAAFVPTSRLDLSVVDAGLRRGLLLQAVRLSDRPRRAARSPRALERLDRPWFSGGTVVAANVQGDLVVPLAGHARFEDGTVDYLGIPAIEIGLRHVERIGIDLISQRVRGARDVAARVRCGGLRHAGRRPGDAHLRPGDVGSARGDDRVQLPAPGRARGRRALRRRCSPRRTTSRVRTGCFCNSGAGETAFSLSRDALVGAEFGDGTILDDFIAHDRHAHGRRRARLARARQQLRRRVPVHAGSPTEFVDLAEVPEDLPPRLAC